MFNKFSKISLNKVFHIKSNMIGYRIKTIENHALEQFPFICSLDIKDGKRRINYKHLKFCENNKAQMRYNCLGIDKEECPCLTALLFPASNEEAADSCRQADGKLVEGSDPALKKFLRHLQVNNADTITKFTEFTLEGYKYIDIDWSKNLDTGVSIKDAENTTDINRRAFICNIPTKDNVNHIDLKDLKSCKIEKIQKLYCSEKSNGLCTCITAFQQPEIREQASKICKSKGGELAKDNDLEDFLEYLKNKNDIKKKTKFTIDGNKHVDIELSEESKVKIAINDDDAKKKKTKSNFLCNIYIPSEELKACKNEKIQSPYKCVGNTRGKCPCMTAFQLPVYREQATEICGNDGAMLTNGDLSYLKRYFIHLKTKNDETIKQYSQYMIGNNKYVDVDWSKADPTITIQEATTESNKRKMSFLCDYMIEDQPSRISIQELKACENKKIQKRFNCIGNERGKCQCMTAFNHTIPRDDATNICEQLDEGKLNKEFMSSDSEFHIFKKFLRKFRDENGDMIKEQTKFFIGNNKYAVVDWSKDLESGITVKDIPNKTMMTEISSLCVSPIQDNIKFIDYTELKNCGNKKIQKSYECVGNDRENCMCMTALLSQTSRKEAVEICERLDGSLSSASLDTIKRHMLHLKENNDESIKEYTEFIIDSGSYVDVDWSKELETRTTILETKDETKNMAFLCEVSIQDNLRYIDFNEAKFKDCKIGKIQHAYNCVGNAREKYSCLTAFQTPKTKSEASEICKKADGMLLSGSHFINNFVDHLKNKNNDSIKVNTKFRIGDGQYVDVWWSEKPERRISIRDSMDVEDRENLKLNFICESLIQDNKMTVDIKELNCKSTQYPSKPTEIISTVEKQVIHTTDIPGHSRTAVPRITKDKKISPTKSSTSLSVNDKIKELEKNIHTLDKDLASTFDSKMLSKVRETRQDIQISLNNLVEKFQSIGKDQNADKQILEQLKKSDESFADYRLHRSKFKETTKFIDRHILFLLISVIASVDFLILCFIFGQNFNNNLLLP